MDKLPPTESVGIILTHVTRIEKIALDPGDTLLIYYDRKKTPPQAVREAMYVVRDMFPSNRVLFVSSEFQAVKSVPVAPIQVVPKKGWWKRFKEWNTIGI